jgi:hypothetical protein
LEAATARKADLLAQISHAKELTDRHTAKIKDLTDDVRASHESVAVAQEQSSAIDAKNQVSIHTLFKKRFYDYLISFATGAYGGDLKAKAIAGWKR